MPDVPLTDVLNSLVEDLYRKASGQVLKLRIPVKVIDDPEIAHKIFKNPAIFTKQYKFLEVLSSGRLSANGDEWKIRASLTQPSYSRATDLLDDATLSAIYQKHLHDYANNVEGDMFQTLLDAAVEVMSKSFGLSHSIPWPTPLIKRIKKALKVQQTIAWTNTSEEAFKQTQAELISIAAEIKSIWAQNSEVTKLLDKLSSQAKDIPHFDPCGELTQNIMAASETTASSIMWAIDCLSRSPELLQQLKQNTDAHKLDLFISEVLRLFPPIPFVTRTCSDATQIADLSFAKNETIIVSIVGIHCHHQHWSTPMNFIPQRPEFINNTYNRYAYIPFLSGARVCGGMKLANKELRIGLTEFLKIYSIKPCPESIAVEYGLTSKPKANLDHYIY